ncbi:pyruvate synthase subunit beta [Oscillibacter sp. MSJ-2]|uniref:Pyruvate synthase subunit beta n=1 Tax=Dysosmobacter acutus TaxID=2841504 RepID=A0ABS6FEI9_9FIRM|nr:thiamine pyrophosphate-dependent enzyme [Dysosmobacter acutus]MBU5628046.1 pyruvate synthase subunit beta [Dysosmobacter acutus]
MLKIETEARGAVTHGVSSCHGCGIELIIRNVLEILGSDTVFVIPPGCAALFSGTGPEAALKVAGVQGNLENSAAIATGIAAGFRHQGNEHTVVTAFAGDGATVDIGIQALSGAMERNENILYICYDNEAYMNTGIQGSSSTPLGASSTTTPAGKTVGSKDLMRIIMAHNVPYAATASVANLPDLRRKVGKAKCVKGCRVLHIHCPCPTGWGIPFAKSIEVAREGVNCGAWVLMEYEDGKVRLAPKPAALGEADKYIKAQKRFRNITAGQLRQVKKNIVERYRYLQELEKI